MNKIAEQTRLRASLEELARFGYPVDVSVADTEVENEKVEIEQGRDVIGSQIFELEDGHVACMADIAVTNQTSRAIYVVGVELRATWDGSLFEWLTPRQVKSQGRAKRESSYSVYQFPWRGPEFEYHEVINHHLVESKRLPAKRPLEGWLLAIGGRIPTGLRHGQLVDLSLTIIGGDHAEYSTTICLYTERLPARTKIVKPRTSIFAKPGEGEAMLARDVTRTAPLPASPPPASNGT